MNPIKPMNLPRPSISGLNRTILAGILLIHSQVSSTAQAPPASFTRTITTGTGSVSVNFAYHPIRSSNFGVLVQQADGSYITHTADVARTYLGTVTDHPEAVAIGLLRADNTLLARISFDDGITWTTTGGNASAGGSTFIPAWPTSVAQNGGAGSIVYGAEVGIDCTSNYFAICGSNVDTAIEKCEFSVMSANMVYLRDAAILHKIGKIIVRADAAQDPYLPDGGDTGLLLPRIKTIWNTSTPMGSTHDLALVVHSAANGGLAYVGVIGTSSRYSANDSDGNGDFSVVWRHEAGHNWGSSHYEGGGNPEGSTIMSNNSLSRFSSSELQKIIAHRNTKSAVLDNLGSYTFPLPPRANQDTASFLRNSPVVVDVMANDSDSNGQSISLRSFDSASDLGGTLTRSAGTGPGGRDQILYTPPPALASGTDWFRYRIQDSSGMQALGYAMLRPRSEVVTLADHWTLDDSSGTTAVNSVRSSLNGTHQNGTLVNQTGANSVTRKGAYFDGSNDQTSIPAPNYSTNAITFTTWIKRSGTQNSSAAFLFTRAGSSVTGFHFGTSNELRYTWDGGGFTWNSGLVPPDNTWCLVAMCVSPGGTTLHLRTPTGLLSATNTASQASEAFNGLMYLGWDPNSSSRHFKGWLDDARVFKSTLAATDIESLYQQALNPPAVTLTAPLSGSSIPPLDVTFSATVGSLQEMVDAVDFTENETSFATATTAPYQALVSSITPGPRTFTARASYGDWGYQADSAPVFLTALPPPPPVVTIKASLPASKRGPIPGSFTFSRDHPIGAITVPLSVGGTAISGTDYDPLPASVTLPDGTLSLTIPVNPIAAAPDGISETVTLSMTGGAGHTPGSPSSATLTINDHITSIADGAWNEAATWNSNAAAPATGTQDSGEGYSVAHIVTSNDTASNSQALVAGSLRVRSGGILDLARLHSSTNQNVSYNLPATAVEDGGTIRFRCSVGTSTHTVAAALAFAGNTSLLINGGSYGNGANLTGSISGSGAIAVSSNTSAGSGTYVHQISINSANNPFTGNWTVNHTGGGDELAALRAGATHALGTGTVTVNNAAQLINDHTTGLNSLAGVTLNGTGATLLLNQPWNNTTANLALTGGTPLVQLGNAASVIGNLTGTTGIIQGSGASSSLTVNQTADTIFSGALGTNLRFIKSGSASLTLTGAPDPTLALTLTAGTLVPPQPVTVASLTQSGGTLRLPLAITPPLTLTGSYARSGGSITVDVTTPPLPDTPYTLIRYLGTLSETPAVTIQDTSGSGLLPIISNGTGSNSSITVTFSTPPPVRYLINYLVDSHGSIVGDASQTVDEGNDASAVTAVPETGYTFTRWSDGLTTASRTDTHITSDLTVTVEFTVNQYPVTYTAASGGSIAGPASQMVTHAGNAAQVTAIPATGFRFDGWSDSLATASRTDSNITAPFGVTATFSQIDPYDAWIASKELIGDDALHTADPDGDGMSNELEFRFDFDPEDPNSRLKMTFNFDGDGHPVLTINKVIAEGTFAIEWTTTLGQPWQGSLAVPVSTGSLDYPFAPPPQSGRCFYRLRVTVP